MGKRAKSARALKRKQARSAEKARRKALYESYKGTGQNKKSKRFKLGNRRARNVLKERTQELVLVTLLGKPVMVLRSVHASRERCGNHACRKRTCRD